MSDVTVVFTTFNPSPSFVETVREVLRHRPVVVVDDGSSRGADVLDEAARLGAVVVHQAENSGIGAALNAGVRAALDGASRFVVTFDQDSAPEPETIDALRATFDRLESAGENVAAVVPGRFAEVRQAVSSAEAPDARRVIQSGMLVPRETFAAIGEFDESLFIDLVDTDFELRILGQRRRIVAASTRIAHELGRTVRLRPFDRLPFTVTTMASTPFRYYYRARNRILLTRRYFRQAPLRMTRDLLVDLVYFSLILLCARPRRAMGALLARGLRDGVRGRGGRIPAELARRATAISWSSAES